MNLGDNSIEECFSVVADIRVIILVDGERSTGVLHCHLPSQFTSSVQGWAIQIKNDSYSYVFYIYSQKR